MQREGEMGWSLVAFWVCLLCEPRLTAAIPVATKWPDADTDDFTTFDDHMSWGTSGDYFDPTMTLEKEFMIESTPPPPAEGMSKLNPGSPNAVNSSGLVESGTPGSPLASNESRILTDSGVTDSPLLATSNREVLLPTISEKDGDVVSSVTTFLPPGLRGEGSFGTKDGDSTTGNESTLFIPRGETPKELLPGPQEKETPQSFPESSRGPAAPSPVPGLFSRNTEQLPAGGLEPASASGSSPPEAEMDAEPVAEVGRGDADSSVVATGSNSDGAATAAGPSADVELSPETTSKVSPGEVQNPEGASSSSNPSSTVDTKDTSVDLAPLSNTLSDSSNLGSDAAPTLSDMQGDSGDATVMDRPEELGGSTGLIEQEVPSAPSAMESESATRGTYADEGSGNGDVLPFWKEVVGTTLGINNNQDETNHLSSETLPGVDKTTEASSTRSSVIADDGSGDFPPFLTESGTLPQSDRLSGEADPSTSSGSPLPESFSPGDEAGKVSSSTPSSENLGSSPEDGIIVGGSRADNASKELIGNEAVMAASSDSQTGTGRPSSGTVSGLTEEGNSLGASAGGEISSQPSVLEGETIATNHVLGEKSPSVSASPTQIGETFTTNLTSGVESPSVSSPQGAKSPLSSGGQPPLQPVFPVSDQPSLSNLGSAASKQAQFPEGPFNMIGKETLQGPSGAESQTVLSSPGMMGNTGSDLASENGSQLSPEGAKKLQPVPSEGAEQLEVYSSITGTDTSLAPSAGESQPASLSPDRTKASGSLTSAGEESHLTPDVAGNEAGESIVEVSEKRPSLPVLSTDAGSALLPGQGVETPEGGKPLGTVADGETASQPSPQLGETTATNSVLGEDSLSSSVSLIAGDTGSLPFPDAGAAVSGPGASKGTTQLEGSSVVSGKKAPSTPLATESQSSGTSAGEEASGSLGKVIPIVIGKIEPAVASKETQLFPDGSAGADEKEPPEGSSSMSEKEAPSTPLATESQSASPSIGGAEVAASSKNEELTPSLPSIVASEHGVGPVSTSIVGGDKSSLTPSATDSHSLGIFSGEEGSGELDIAGVKNSGSSLLSIKGASASPTESGTSPENVIAWLGEKFGPTPGGESIPAQPSSADEPVAQNYNDSEGSVLSVSSSPKESVAAQGTPQQMSDITDPSQLPSGNENMSDDGANLDKAGEREPLLLDGSKPPGGAQSLGDVASEPSSGLSSQTAEDTSGGIEMGKIDSSSSDSVAQVAGPLLPGLSSSSNELLAPLWNSEGRGDADSFVSTIDKGTPAIIGEEGHISLPGAQLSLSGTGGLWLFGEAKPGAEAKAILPSAKDKVPGSGDGPSTSVLTSSGNTTSGLESANTGSVYGSSILPALVSSAQVQPAVRVTEDSLGSTKPSSPESKPEASDVGQEKTKSLQSKSSDKKKEDKKADKKQDSKKTDKKKESKNSDSNSKTGKAKNTNEDPGKLRVVPAVLTSTPSVAPLFPYGPKANDTECVERKVDFKSPLFKPDLGIPLGKRLLDSLYFTDNGQIIFPDSDEDNYTYSDPPTGGFNGQEKIPMVAVFWDNADFSNGPGTIFYQEYVTQNSAKPALVQDVEARVRQYESSSYSARWTLKITWVNVQRYPAQQKTSRTNTYQAILTTDGYRAYTIFLYQHDGMQWDYTKLPSTNVLVGYTSGDGFFKNDDLMATTPAEKYRPDRFKAYNTGVNGQWLYKLVSWIQVNYRQKCLDWVNHEPQPSVWNQNLPVCPCLVQQGLLDHRYTRSHGWLDSRVTMLHSSVPNKFGAGIRCLYDKNNNQLVEGRQERIWRHWRRSPFGDEELKLYYWCCNRAGSQRVCEKYNQKRAKVGCDGYRPPVRAPPTSSSEEEESRERD